MLHFLDNSGCKGFWFKSDTADNGVEPCGSWVRGPLDGDGTARFEEVDGAPVWNSLYRDEIRINYSLIFNHNVLEHK